jgi:hypothetical protein
LVLADGDRRSDSPIPDLRAAPEGVVQISSDLDLEGADGQLR